MKRPRPITAFAIVQPGRRAPWLIPCTVAGQRDDAIRNACDLWADQPEDVDRQTKWRRLRKLCGYRAVKVQVSAIGRPR